MAVYEIAGIRFQIEVTDAPTKQQMAPYQVSVDTAQEILSVTEADIDYERSLQPEASYSAMYTCAVCRQVSQALLYRHKGIFIHAGVLLYQGKGYLFVAPSGTGKTTHLLLWQKCLGDKMAILNGDKPFLRSFDDGVIVYGGPWKGKENFGINASAPLGGVFLLNRGTENTVRRASVPEALQGLLLSTIFPEDREGVSKMMDMMNRICSTVPVGILHCNTQDDAVYTVQKFIEENEKQY